LHRLRRDQVIEVRRSELKRAVCKHVDYSEAVPSLAEVEWALERKVVDAFTWWWE
jgi:hypothetical protein